jgi:hypothetical protein
MPDLSISNPVVIVFALLLTMLICGALWDRMARKEGEVMDELTIKGLIFVDLVPFPYCKNDETGDRDVNESEYALYWSRETDSTRATAGDLDRAVKTWSRKEREN